MKLASILVVLLLLTVVKVPSLAQERETRIRFSIVDDQNMPLRDLKSSDLQIRIDKSTLRISSLRFSAEQPLSVLIVIDASESEERMLPLERQFAARFIDQILRKDQDRVSVAKFSRKMDLLYVAGNDFSDAKAKIDSIDFEVPKDYIGGTIVTPQSPPSVSPPGQSFGSTPLFDTISQAVSILVNNESKGKRNIVLLISDGVDTSGEKNLTEAVKKWKLSDVTVYSVGIGDKNYDGVDSRTLKQIAEGTGGLAIIPKDLKDQSREIAKLASSMRFFYEASVTDMLESTKGLEISVNNSRTLHSKFRVDSIAIR